MPRLLPVLLVGLAIPVFGFIVSAWILADVASDLRDQGISSVQELCATNSLRPGPALRQFCAYINPIQLLRKGSIYAGLFGIGVPALFWLASAFVGNSRSRIAVIFPALVRSSTVFLAIMVLAQGAIVTSALWFGESHLIGRVHGQLIVLIGFGAIVCAGGLISAAASLRTRLRTQINGSRVTPESEPALYGFVHALSARLGSRPPDNIIVGLDPTFFVTSAEVETNSGVLTGESLFVSTSLGRVLSDDEFAAVIGHELGHFRGSDTQYSMKFAPIYAGLGRASDALTAFNDYRALASIPALYMLSYMRIVFASNERTIGREREFVADRAGAEASSAEALATALVKVATYAPLWEYVRSRSMEHLKEGQMYANLGIAFENVARYASEHESLDAIRSRILEARIAHPIDTHPPTSERLAALSVVQTSITKDLLAIPDRPAAQILNGLARTEEELTLVEHRRIVALSSTPKTSS